MTFEEWIKKASLNPKKMFLSQEDLKKMYEIMTKPSPPKMWTPFMDPGVKDESHLWEAQVMGEFVNFEKLFPFPVNDPLIPDPFLIPKELLPTFFQPEDDCTCLACQMAKKMMPVTDHEHCDCHEHRKPTKDPLDQIAARFEENWKRAEDSCRLKEQNYPKTLTQHDS